MKDIQVLTFDPLKDGQKHGRRALASANMPAFQRGRRRSALALGDSGERAREPMTHPGRWVDAQRRGLGLVGRAGDGKGNTHPGAAPRSRRSRCTGRGQGFRTSEPPEAAGGDWSCALVPTARRGARSSADGARATPRSSAPSEPLNGDRGPDAIARHDQRVGEGGAAHSNRSLLTSASAAGAARGGRRGGVEVTSACGAAWA